MTTNILLNIPLRYWQDFQDSIARISNTNIYVFDVNGKAFSNFSQDVETCQRVNEGKTVRNEKCIHSYKSAFENLQDKEEGTFVCPYGYRLYIHSLGSHVQKIGYVAVNPLESGNQSGGSESYLVQRASRICRTINEVLKAIIEKTVLGMRRLELNSIYEISNLLTSTVELSKAMELITNSLIILYDADIVILGLCEGDEIRLAQATGEYKDLLVGSRWSMDDPLMSKTFLKGEPLLVKVGDLKSLEGITSLKVDPESKVVMYPLYSFLGAVGLLVIMFPPYATAADFGSRNFQIYANFAAIALANARLVDQLEREAQTDFLTGVYNKRVLLSVLGHELEKSRRYATPLSVIFLDIDNFKAYNDAYGHIAGDVVLRKTAETIKKSVRQADFTGRYGGEEFVVILPGAEKKDAFAVAEKIRKAIELTTFPYRKVTVSLGVTSAKTSDSTDSLIDRADQCLYQAKRQGKNYIYVDPS